MARSLPARPERSLRAGQELAKSFGRGLALKRPAGYGRPTTRATVEATLPQQPEDVFDLLADIRNEERWHPDYRGAEKITPGPVAAGTVFDARYRGFGRMRVEIAEYDRPRRLRFVAVCRPMEMDAAFELAPTEGGTSVSLDISAALRGPFRFATPVFGPILRREVGKRPRQVELAFEPPAPETSAAVE